MLQEQWVYLRRRPSLERRGRSLWIVAPSAFCPLRSSSERTSPSLTLRCFGLAIFLFSAVPFARTAEVIHVADFGAVGDGKTDDAAALAKALNAVAHASKPAVLRFGQGRVYRVASGAGYVIDLQQQDHITIDGEDALLLLGGEHRGVSLRQCRDVVLRGLRFDFDPLPFVETLVTAVDGRSRSVTLQITDAFLPPPHGGPTKLADEQAYFAMLWNPGPHSLRSTHYWLADLTAVPGRARELRATAEKRFQGFDTITPGLTRMTVPVRGIAHRRGAGAVLHLDGNRDIVCEDMEIWSAPWFACTIQRNEGPVTLRRVHIRPRPGTQRITSSWRDGIHAKGNRGRLLFEDCVLEGMNDDAMNVATFLSRVESVDDTQLRVRQNFPLCFVAWRVGDTLAAYSAKKGTLLGQSRVIDVAEQAQSNPAHAPRVSLKLASAIPDLAPGDHVWAVEAANPQTVIRRCTIVNSCRFQSPVTLDQCHVTAFLWFYGEHIEGPLPEGSVVRGCTLRLGRGNRDLAISCDGWLHGLPSPNEAEGLPPLRNLRFEDNFIDGQVEIKHVREVQLVNNRFAPERGKITVRHSRDVLIKDTRLGSKPFPMDRLLIEGKETQESLKVR